MLAYVKANTSSFILPADWSLRDAIRRLESLKSYPPEKPNHVLYNAVHTPLPILGAPLWTDDQDVNWHVEEAEIEISKLESRQRYIYPDKTRWYMKHPAQIETPQLHKAKWWLLATVYHVDDHWLVGNGNHRVSAAMFLGWPQIKVRLLTPEVTQ